MKHRCATLLLVALQTALQIAGFATPAAAQVPGAGVLSTPQAISGIATSARHCISGNAANIHNLGWIDARAGYNVTFDADFEIVSAITRMDLSGRSALVVDGLPQFNGIAQTPGTAVLHVGARSSRAGCYSYKVVITPATSAGASAEAEGLSAETARLVPRAIATAGPLAISGTPTSAYHCVGGNSYVAGVHEIGRLDRAGRVTITFDADFNAIVAAMSTLLSSSGAPADAGFVIHDTTGDNRNPSLDFDSGAGDNVVLYIAGLNGAPGCYRYKAEIR